MATDRPHRPVTLVFSDLKGSTALAERLDAETLRAVLTRYFDAMRGVFEAHGGFVAKIIGDAIVTVFDGTDDPADAARRAAAAVIASHGTLDWLNDRFDASWAVRLQNRTGVASGEISAADLDESRTDADVLAGDVVGAAESLESNSPAMEALIDEVTLDLLGESVEVEAIGPVPRKGRSGTIEAWRLVAFEAGEGPEAAASATGAEQVCAACGATNQRGDRRCASCGATLSAGDNARESRRMVTIVFADPKPTHVDGRPLAGDETHFAMTRYVEVMRPTLERHGGTVEKFIGDAMMAVFGLPVRHEDDAVRAVRAASDMQAALVDLNAELFDQIGVRFANPIGVNTGTVVAGDASLGQRLVTGDAVNVAARLEQTAKAGEVILGDLTRRLVGDAAEVETLEPLSLKGKAKPVPAFRLVRLTGSARASRQHDLPLIGRDYELAILQEEFRNAQRKRRAVRVTLIGDAGVGKSRLTHEFQDEIEDEARIVSGHCLPYGDGITFWPFLRVVQHAAGIEDGDDAETARSRIRALIPDDPDVLARVESIAGLIDTPFAMAELVWAMRRFLEELAESRPLVVILDDIHWAEQALLDAVDELTKSLRVPTLILCTARTAVLDTFPAFVSDARCLQLEPLSVEQCEAFLRFRLGAGVAETGVDAKAVARIAEAAGGNPLFLEQLLSMLIDEGRLREANGHWRLEGDLATLALPATIEAVLAARLDRLTTDERQVIEPASVIGRHFIQDAVLSLVDEGFKPKVHDRLEGLVDRDLVLPLADEEPAYRFQSLLVRDATYNGLLKEARAILHERLVAWGDAVNQARNRTTEFEEIQGHHLEQAYHYWCDLGPLDNHVIKIGLDASRRLASAGERALTRGDMAAAATLLGRAAALLPALHDSRPRLLLLSGNALHETGAFEQAIVAYEASAEAADALGNRAAAAAGRIEGLRLQYLVGRLDEGRDVGAELEGSLAELEGLGDPDALSRAWQLRLNINLEACRWADTQEAANKVIEHARRAGNSVLEVRTMPLLAFLAQKGPMPVAEATAVCRDILERVSFDRRSTSLTQLELALLSAMGEDLAEARRLCQDTRQVLGDLGWEMQAALVSLSSGPIELLADEPARAEAELRQDYDALNRMEERNFISLTAALLAEAVYRQRRFDEASTLVEFSRELAVPDDLAVQIIARSVAGKLAARRGDTANGLALSREAVAMIETTDDPSGQGDALLDLAETCFIAGDTAHASAAAATAIDRYRAKGNLAGVRRAQRIAEAIGAGQDPLA